MITSENRRALRDKCIGHFPEIGQLVEPVRVSAQYVGQVLQGKRDSVAVIKAAVKFLASKNAEADALNSEITEQITT